MRRSGGPNGAWLSGTALCPLAGVKPTAFLFGAVRLAMALRDYQVERVVINALEMRLCRLRVAPWAMGTVLRKSRSTLAPREGVDTKAAQRVADFIRRRGLL